MDAWDIWKEPAAVVATSENADSAFFDGPANDDDALFTTPTSTAQASANPPAVALEVNRPLNEAAASNAHDSENVLTQTGPSESCSSTLVSAEHVAGSLLQAAPTFPAAPIAQAELPSVVSTAHVPTAASAAQVPSRDIVAPHVNLGAAPEGRDSHAHGHHPGAVDAALPDTTGNIAPNPLARSRSTTATSAIAGAQSIPGNAAESETNTEADDRTNDHDDDAVDRLTAAVAASVEREAIAKAQLGQAVATIGGLIAAENARRNRFLFHTPALLAEDGEHLEGAVSTPARNVVSRLASAFKSSLRRRSSRVGGGHNTGVNSTLGASVDGLSVNGAPTRPDLLILTTPARARKETRGPATARGGGGGEAASARRRGLPPLPPPPQPPTHTGHNVGGGAAAAAVSAAMLARETAIASAVLEGMGDGDAAGDDGNFNAASAIRPSRLVHGEATAMEATMSFAEFQAPVVHGTPLTQPSVPAISPSREADAVGEVVARTSNVRSTEIRAASVTELQSQFEQGRQIALFATKIEREQLRAALDGALATAERFGCGEEVKGAAKAAARAVIAVPKRGDAAATSPPSIDAYPDSVDASDTVDAEAPSNAAPLESELRALREELSITRAKHALECASLVDAARSSLDAVRSQLVAQYESKLTTAVADVRNTVRKELIPQFELRLAEKLDASCAAARATARAELIPQFQAKLIAVRADAEAAARAELIPQFEAKLAAARADAAAAARAELVPQFEAKLAAARADAEAAARSVRVAHAEAQQLSTAAVLDHVASSTAPSTPKRGAPPAGDAARVIPPDSIPKVSPTPHDRLSADKIREGNIREEAVTQRERAAAEAALTSLVRIVKASLAGGEMATAAQSSVMSAEREEEVTARIAAAVADARHSARAEIIAQARTKLETVLAAHATVEAALAQMRQRAAVAESRLAELQDERESMAAELAAARAASAAAASSALTVEEVRSLRSAGERLHAAATAAEEDAAQQRSVARAAQSRCDALAAAYATLQGQYATLKSEADAARAACTALVAELNVARNATCTAASVAKHTIDDTVPNAIKSLKQQHDVEMEALRSEAREAAAAAKAAHDAAVEALRSEAREAAAATQAAHNAAMEALRAEACEAAAAAKAAHDAAMEALRSEAREAAAATQAAHDAAMEALRAEACEATAAAKAAHDAAVEALRAEAHEAAAATQAAHDAAMEALRSEAREAAAAAKAAEDLHNSELARLSAQLEAATDLLDAASAGEASARESAAVAVDEARRARIAAAVSEESHVAEATAASSMLSDMRARLRHAEEALAATEAAAAAAAEAAAVASDDARHAATAAAARQRELLAEVADLRAQLQEANGARIDIFASHNATSNMTAELARVESALLSVQHRNAALEQQLEAARADVLQANLATAHSHELENDIAASAAHVERLEISVAHLRTSLADANAAAQRSSEYSATLELQVSSLQSALEALAERSSGGRAEELSTAAAVATTTVISLSTESPTHERARAISTPSAQATDRHHGALVDRVSRLTEALEASLAREAAAAEDAARLRGVLEAVQWKLEARAAEVRMAWSADGPVSNKAARQGTHVAPTL